MCGVQRESQEPDRVGVRELRQNLSVYLSRVKAGETLIVTEHGRDVGLLEPLRATHGVLAQMIASGVVVPPTDPGGWIRTEPIPYDGPPAEDVIREMRDDRI